MTATPTERWLTAAAAEGLPALPAEDVASHVAERLLLLVHYGIDWKQGWVSRYRKTYWERILPERVMVATYRNQNLRRWWGDIAGELESKPRNRAERSELERLIWTPDQRPVLEVLRFETEALLLRVRITADAVRAARPLEEEI